MKAVQSMARNAQSCLLVEPLEKVSQTTRELGGGRQVVVDGQRTPIGSITDRDLASAAFTQAVALYDSCIRCAVATRLALRPGRARVRSCSVSSP